VLAAVSEQVEPRKLERLAEVLEAALGRPLAKSRLDDPVIVRRALVEYLRQRGTSAGIIQSFEQLFMGIARRAALLGLAPVPPEGPWSLTWQRVLDAVGTPGSKAALRSFAAWATSKGTQPLDVDTSDLERWSKDLAMPAGTARLVEEALADWRELSQSKPPTGATLREERLRLKALRGSVRREAVAE